jgi:hypothetical protein
MQLLQGVRSLVIEEIKFGVICGGWTCDEQVNIITVVSVFFLAWSNPIDGDQTCLISCGVTHEDRATFFAAEDISRTLIHRLEIFPFAACASVPSMKSDGEILF